MSPGYQKRPTPSEYRSTMHSSANGHRRIYLLGNSMNKRQEKKGQDPGSLRCPRVPATSAAIVVESASALEAETTLVGVLAQELTGTFRDAITHGGVVLLDGQHHVQADSVHEPKGGTPARVKISHMASTSSGGATPSSTTIRHSRLIAAQMRLKMKPSLSRRTWKGTSPYWGSFSISASMTPSSVLPHDISSTALSSGGCW